MVHMDPYALQASVSLWFSPSLFLVLLVLLSLGDVACIGGMRTSISVTLIILRCIVRARTLLSLTPLKFADDTRLWYCTCPVSASVFHLCKYWRACLHQSWLEPCIANMIVA